MGILSFMDISIRFLPVWGWTLTMSAGGKIRLCEGYNDYYDYESWYEDDWEGWDDYEDDWDWIDWLFFEDDDYWEDDSWGRMGKRSVLGQSLETAGQIA